MSLMIFIDKLKFALWVRQMSYLPHVLTQHREAPELTMMKRLVDSSVNQSACTQILIIAVINYILT